MRWECKVPGLEGNWIEVADSWTRNEEKALDEAKGDDVKFFAIWRAKVTACHLVTADGRTLTAPAEVEASVGDLDIAVLQGMGSVLDFARFERRKLGNASWRLSSNGTAPNGPAAAAKAPRSRTKS